ncbi:MAG: ABC transporter substrate-binding protein [Dehalococcoidia bacterium]|jgi:peptide/nickel transport system substrate-binding protein|nr:ABC transporter substrate-binding protein [Dehalococcoidia bacterium]
MRTIGHVLSALVAIALLAGSAACTGPAPSENPQSHPTTPTMSPVPSVAPVVLRVGTTKPFKTTNRFADYWYGVLSNITTHDSLIKLGPDMKPVPWLATGWTISDDSRTYTFTIAEDAECHDGVLLTPYDVKFSIEYYRDKDPQAGWMQDVIESVTVDGNDVILSLTRPYGNLLTEFMTYSVVPESVWGAVEDPLTYEGADRVIGSGPFALESWDPAAGRFVFVANEYYFQEETTIDRLEVNVYRTMDALVMALANGEIDTWWDYSGEFPYTHVPPLQESGNVEFATSTYLGVPAAIGFNIDRPATSDLAFRQAVAAAINYEQIVDLVFSGYGSTPTAGFVPPTHPNFNADLPELAQDVAKANRLLDSLSWMDTNGDGIREGADGKNIVLRLLTRGDVSSTLRATEMVAADLEAVGIDSAVRGVDNATWIAAKDAMDYDLVFFRATPWGTLMHASHGSGYFDSRRTGAGVLHNLAAPEYLAVCDARLATGDPAEQERLDRELQQLHSDYLPGIALAWTESLYPYRKGWEDWTIDNIYGGVVNSFSWSTVTKK